MNYLTLHDHSSAGSAVGRHNRSEFLLGGQSNSSRNGTTGSILMDGIGNSKNSIPNQNGKAGYLWGLFLGQCKETPKAASNHQSMSSGNGFAEIATF